MIILIINSRQAYINYAVEAAIIKLANGRINGESVF